MRLWFFFVAESLFRWRQSLEWLELFSLWWRPKFPCCVCYILPLSTVMIYAKSVCNVEHYAYFYKVNFNIILPTTFIFSKWFWFLRFTDRKNVFVSSNLPLTLFLHPWIFKQTDEYYLTILVLLPPKPNTWQPNPFSYHWAPALIYI
jgi:hypothetical protein